MIRALVLLLLVPATGLAVICKSVAPDGSVTYEDLPADQCEQPVDLPAYSTYTPRRIDLPVDTTPASTPADDAGDDEGFAGYRELRIVRPADGDTVRNNNGEVPVELQAEPGLQPGHLVRLSLDGVPVSGDFDGLAINLNNVERGSHGLSAAIHDAAGSRLVASDVVQFTMRQASILNRPEATEGGEDTGGQAAAGSRPKPVPSGPAPAGTHPAYRPTYSQ